MSCEEHREFRNGEMYRGFRIVERGKTAPSFTVWQLYAQHVEAARAYSDALGIKFVGPGIDCGLYFDLTKEEMKLEVDAVLASV